jgi:hypothetical protein
LKYIFLAGKIIRTARSVVLKLSAKYHTEKYMNKAFPKKHPFYMTQPVISILKQAGKDIFKV